MTDSLYTYHFDPDRQEILVRDEHGEQIGEIEFHGDGKVWTIDHTGVDPSHRGSGIAGELVNQLVIKAREHDVMLKATCPYAKRVLETTPAFQDRLLQD